MGIITRTKMILRMRTSAALDGLENPVQVLDYGESQQRELLRTVSQGLVEVATARQRLERQARRLRDQIPMMERQARQGLGADREDLARVSLQRKQIALNELTDLEAQIAAVSEEERTLTTAHQQLTVRVEEFRHHRTVITARYESASARVRVNESLTGVSGELAELAIAVGRAEEKTERLSARASAIDALVESGVLSTPLGEIDRIERELREINTKRLVDEELAALRIDLGRVPSDEDS